MAPPSAMQIEQPSVMLHNMGGEQTRKHRSWPLPLFLYSIYCRYSNKKIALSRPSGEPLQCVWHLGVHATTYWHNLIPHLLYAVLWVKVRRNENPVMTDLEAERAVTVNHRSPTVTSGRQTLLAMFWIWSWLRRVPVISVSRGISSAWSKTYLS